jgi:hypothetical protein
MGHVSRAVSQHRPKWRSGEEVNAYGMPSHQRGELIYAALLLTVAQQSYLHAVCTSYMLSGSNCPLRCALCSSESGGTSLRIRCAASRCMASSTCGLHARLWRRQGWRPGFQLLLHRPAVPPCCTALLCYPVCCPAVLPCCTRRPSGACQSGSMLGRMQLGMSSRWL